MYDTFCHKDLLVELNKQMYLMDWGNWIMLQDLLLI